MSPEIIEKLNNFVKSHKTFTEECQIVYLMVEIRKLLDGSKYSKDYNYIRFHCDWLLHTEKTKNLYVIAADFSKVILEIEDRSQKSIFQSILDNDQVPFSDFVSFKKLRKELKEFCKVHSINQTFIEADDYWFSFRNLMWEVLIDQPIDFRDAPVNGIKKIFFSRVKRGFFGVILNVEFVINPKIEIKRFFWADQEKNFQI